MSSHDDHKTDIDIEAAIGSGLTRQISVNLTHEQFERLYLQPGGDKSKGDAAKRYGNPTALGLASFLLCLTPFSCNLMGWGGATSAAAVTTAGAFFYIGGVGLFLSGLLEWIVGNTFPFIVFVSFSGFWFAQGFTESPAAAIAGSFAGDMKDYYLGTGFYLLWWGVLTFIYLVASLRTNVVFVLLFFVLDIAFFLLTATYFALASGAANAGVILKAGGVFGFITCAIGWYLLVVLIFDSTGIPVKLPVGDLSGFMSGRKNKAS